MHAEAWLRGPLEHIDPFLMPAAHALVQAGEEIERAAAELTPAEVWARPGGAASVGFHLRHIAGSIDRLLAYARSAGLTEAQFQALRHEGEAGDPPAEANELLSLAHQAIARAMETIRSTPREILLEPRTVGRARLPTNTLGLLFHIGEHTQRHAGQTVTTAKIVRGLREAGIAS